MFLAVATKKIFFFYRIPNENAGKILEIPDKNVGNCFGILGASLGACASILSLQNTVAGEHLDV